MTEPLPEVSVTHILQMLDAIPHLCRAVRMMDVWLKAHPEAITQDRCGMLAEVVRTTQQAMDRLPKPKTEEA